MENIVLTCLKVVKNDFFCYFLPIPNCILFDNKDVSLRGIQRNRDTATPHKRET